MPRIRIYTTSYCGFCRMAKQFLREKGVRFEEIDVTDDPDTRRRLLEETGSRTVPQVFVEDRPIGGYTDLVSLDRTGRLDPLLTGNEDA